MSGKTRRFERCWECGQDTHGELVHSCKRDSVGDLVANVESSFRGPGQLLVIRALIELSMRTAQAEAGRREAEIVRGIHDVIARSRDERPDPLSPAGDVVLARLSRLDKAIDVATRMGALRGEEGAQMNRLADSVSAAIEEERRTRPDEKSIQVALLDKLRVAGFLNAYTAARDATSESILCSLDEPDEHRRAWENQSLG